MTGSTARPWGARLLTAAFVVYAGGLVIWLTLGILPTLAADVPAVGALLNRLAEGTGPIAGFAHRIMSADAADVMANENPWLQYGFSLLNLTLALVLAVRRFDQLVPRLLAFALLGTAATFNDVSHRAFHITGSPWPIAAAHFTFHVVSGVTYFWAVVLFPDGRLPNAVRLRRPRLQQAVGVLVTAVLVAVCWFSNFLQHPQFFVVFFGIVVPLSGVGMQALRLRDRRSTATDQAAARLLIAALLPALAVAVCWLGFRAVVALGGAGAIPVADWLQQAFPVVFALVPVVLTAGVIRYRWWDLDRVLVRVLVYGVLGTGVAVVYLVAVATGTALAGGGLWWLVLLLALGAAVIEPVRRSATTAANRIVYGQLLSPAAGLQQLIEGMETLSPQRSMAQIESVAVSATRAESATVWLADGAGWVRAVDADLDAAPGADRRPAAPAEGGASWSIEYQGEELGRLTVDLAPGVQLAPADRQLLTDLAGHAGLVVHNAMLADRLAGDVRRLDERSAELTGARRRLVEAQDQERRHLERDLHDGAQQALVAAIIELRVIGDAPTVDALEPLREVLDTGRSWLEQVGRDDLPTELVEYGLAGALDRSARLLRATGAEVVVEVQVPHGQPSTAHAAVYFCCSEALQNVAKHARARHVVVQVEDVGDRIEFTLADDGVGFRPGEVDQGGGLAALADRCALLGGVFRMHSTPGGGTLIAGWVPTPADNGSVGNGWTEAAAAVAAVRPSEVGS